MCPVCCARSPSMSGSWWRLVMIAEPAYLEQMLGRLKLTAIRDRRSGEERPGPPALLSTQYPAARLKGA
jgi:hypothetical protein